MDTSLWPQQGVEKRVRLHKGKALNCPRCNSTNTKFCYYNNYSLSQPRYFCKSCRRYWTEGGSLRNVPVGGGSRKNKRSYSSSLSSSQTSSTITALAATASSSTSLISSSSPSKLIPHELRSFSMISSSVSALEPIRSGISSRRFIPFEVTSSSKEDELSANARIKLRTLTPFDQSLYWQELHASGMSKPRDFGMQGMPKPRDFGIQDIIWPSKVRVPFEYGVGSMEERKEGGDGRLSFPFEDLKQGTTRNDCDEIVEGVDPTLFWEGIMGNGEGGGW